MASRIGLAAVVALALSAGAAGAAQGDDAVSPVSQRLTQSGFASLTAKNYVAAIDDFETALAVDPKNRTAFIGLARVAQAQGLPGKAVKYYREALQLDPNDLSALEGQGQAFAERGAKARAQANLDRIRTLCRSDCAPAKRLETAISQTTVAQSSPTGPATSAKN
jgi:Tfp pilus assembly protein PilF